MNPAPPEPGLHSVEWLCTTLPVDLAAVGPAAEKLRTWLGERGAAAGPPLDGVILAVTEALSNAIRHGCKPAGAQVRMACAWRAGELELEVSEPGDFAPAENWSRLPEDLLAEHGRGGYLITRLMDAVQHRNANGRHILQLRKRLPQVPSPADAAENEAMVEEMTEELGNAYETIATLLDFARALATSPSLAALAAKSFERLRPLTNASAVWVRLIQADGTMSLLAEAGEVPGPEVLSAGAPVTEMIVATGGTERTLAHRNGLPPDDPLHGSGGCAFVCPFAFENRLRGVVVVVRDDDASGFFTAGQLGLVRTLADFMGIACGSADLLAQRRESEHAARQLEFAEQIQRGLLPQKIPAHPAWSVHGVCAQAAEVGGDFYDVIDLPDGRRLVVIADVMGKGMSAALLAATLRSAMRAHAAGATDPAVLLTQVNRQLCDDLQHLEMFITAQVIQLEASGALLTFASAGHCPILKLVSTGGIAEWWEGSGLPLGVAADEIYQGVPAQLQPGDYLLLMTDGVVEHEDANGREFGKENLAAMVRSIPDKSTPALGPAVLQRLQDRAGGKPPRDDCTLVAITPLKDIQP
jgi:serine phosphatase RsbU (regulator of sigma subunit)/anti-sigma regulatory factor (Ser/Thr protein kinase)